MNTRNLKNAKNICKKSGLLLLALIFMLNLCCCSQPEIVSPLEGTEGKKPENELSQPLKIAEVYSQFLIDSDSDNGGQVEIFREAVKDAESVGNDGYSSDEKIKTATDSLMQAINVFHSYMFEPDKEKTKDADLIKSLKIGDAKCAYDSKSRTFYFTMGNNPERKVEFDFAAASGFDRSNSESDEIKKTHVFAEILDENGNICPYSFIPQLNTAYTLRAYSNTYAFDYKIIFSVLPIVQISDVNRISDDYRECTISVTDPSFVFSPYETALLYIESTAKIHIRGGMSRGLPKKSYSIKFVDEAGANKDIPLLSMRKDSDWILDAMYIDKARARNRVSTDLWHEMDSPLYYMNEGMKEQTNGTHGEFVEVFLNDAYQGLYCLTEKVDRKQLQLLKNDNTSEENNTFRSVIYKGKSWGQAILFKGISGYSNNSSWWESFEQKFPNPSKGGEIRWEPLYNFIKFFLESSDEEFAADVGKYIDIDNFVEYTILMCISYAYDNTGKNAYWSVYDVTDENLSKIFLTPWDLDASWGRSWNSDKTSSTKEWMDSEMEHDTALFRRLVLTNAQGFADKLRQRWAELKDNVLSVESILKKFSGYFDLFESSGAWERESSLWKESGLDIAKESAYIKEWTEERWEYIDDLIMNKLDTVGQFAPQPSTRRRR